MTPSLPRLARHATFLAALPLLVGGCSSKTTVQALQPAEVDRAAQFKQVGVLPFEKDTVGLGASIETALAAHVIDGNSYFTVVSRDRLDAILQEQRLQSSGMVDGKQLAQVGKLTGAQALITGTVAGASYSDSHYREEREECKDDKCKEKRTWRVRCTKRTVDLSAQIKMIDVERGDLVTAQSMSETVSWDHCADQDDGLPSPAYGHQLLAREMADAFLQKIAPRYVHFQVTLLDELDVKAPRQQEQKFENALEYLKKNRLKRSGELLDQLMAETGMRSYAVAYNLGVVRESEGLYDDASRLYTLADRLAGGPIDEIDAAIHRINRLIAQRKAALDQLAR